MTEDHWLGVAYDSNPAIYVLDNSTRTFTLMYTFDGHFGVDSIQISADHKYVALGKDSGYVIIYQLIDGTYQRMQDLPPDGGRAWSVSLTADGMQLAVGRVGYTVSVYMNIGGSFVSNLTINTQ